MQSSTSYNNFGCIHSLVSFFSLYSFNKKPKIIFEIHINFLIYSAVLWFSALAATIIMFLLDKIMDKTLELGKLNFFNYVYPLFVISNILAISMPYCISKPYIVSSFYILLTISFFVNFIQNEKIFKKDKVYNFSIDFTVCNLCFIDLAIFSVINSSLSAARIIFDYNSICQWSVNPINFVSRFCHCQTPRQLWSTLCCLKK